MQVITEVDPPPWPGERTVVTIGAYDGVHRGHQAVIAEVSASPSARAPGPWSSRSTATRRRSSGRSRWPPGDDVGPERPQLLTSPSTPRAAGRDRLDGTVVLHFDEAQSKESPESFIERVLIAGLAVKVVVVGEDFHFGSHR